MLSPELGGRMQRREFITLLGGAAAAWPVVARAQQSENPVRIGFLPLGSLSNTYDQSLVEAFQQGLRDAGLVENQQVKLDIVWVSSIPEFSQAASDLVQRGAKLLVTAGSSASAAAKHQTSTIPIVFISVGNPIGIGLPWPTQTHLVCRHGPSDGRVVGAPNHRGVPVGYGTEISYS
jgi:putative ABC transport system substrate-binding protein